MKYRLSHQDVQYNKIQCIKGIRAVTGWSLRESKDFVDEMMNDGYRYLDLGADNADILRREYGFTLVNMTQECAIPKELFEFEPTARFRMSETNEFNFEGNVVLDNGGEPVAYECPGRAGVFFRSDDGTWKSITYSDFKMVREILAVMG